MFEFVCYCFLNIKFLIIEVHPMNYGMHSDAVRVELGISIIQFILMLNWSITNN